MNSRRTTSALTLCVESLFGSEQIEVTTHHEQLSADTSSHANGCKGISSADGSGHDEKEGAADHLSIVASTIFRSIVRVARQYSCEFVRFWQMVCVGGHRHIIVSRSLMESRCQDVEESINQ